MEIVQAQESKTLSSWQEGIIADDMLGVEKILESGIRSEDKLPKELATRLLKAGGKRIRPLLLCLCYRSQENTAGASPRASLEDLYTLAAVAEWVHTATLFHDDVIDSSPKRRNIDAAHILHDNKIAILVGDFVYAEAFAILMERGLLEPSKKLANTIKKLVEGELWQHSYSKTRKICSKEYEKVAESKTAALFAWATETGVWASGINQHEAAYEFGRNLGIAFQIADDLLDTYDLDPNNADHDELIEWFYSAPPLPLCLAKDLDPSVERAWTKIDIIDSKENLKNLITQLQSYCLQEEVIAACEKKLNSYLEASRVALSKLGSPRSLHQAIELLEARGKLGIELARTAAAGRA